MKGSVMSDIDQPISPENMPTMPEMRERAKRFHQQCWPKDLAPLPQAFYDIMITNMAGYAYHEVTYALAVANKSE
jgi:hypothetical protein